MDYTKFLTAVSGVTNEKKTVAGVAFRQRQVTMGLQSVYAVKRFTSKRSAACRREKCPAGPLSGRHHNTCRQLRCACARAALGRSVASWSAQRNFLDASRVNRSAQRISTN